MKPEMNKYIDATKLEDKLRARCKAACGHKMLDGSVRCHECEVWSMREMVGAAPGVDIRDIVNSKEFERYLRVRCLTVIASETLACLYDQLSTQIR